MCTLFFTLTHSGSIILAGNRDEFYDRPSSPIALRDGGIICGLDERSGGTWLALSKKGRIAVVTNIRRPGVERTGAKSRGILPLEAVASDLPLLELKEKLLPLLTETNPGNLVVLESGAGIFLSTIFAPQNLLPGTVYALSNGDLDEPWPKVTKGREYFRNLLTSSVKPSELLSLLGNPQIAPDAELPDTGVGIERERFLSSIFIQSEHYGTRVSTAVIITASGETHVTERSFGPRGVQIGEREIKS